MNLINVEIWRAGVATDGRKITPKDVQEVFENSYLLQSEGYNIPVKVGHGDTTQEAKGWVKNLKLRGNSIYGDFMGIDTEIFKKIHHNQLPHRSAEIWNFINWNGKKYKNVLGAVALLGIDTPALYLNPVETFENNRIKNSFLINEIKDIGDTIMGVEYDEKILKENFELKKQLEQIKNQKVDTFQKENSELRSLLEKYQKEDEQKKLEFAKLKEQVENYEKQKKDEYFAKLDEEIENDIIKTGKIAPADKELVVSLFSAFGYDPEKHGLIKEVFKKVKGIDLTNENFEVTKPVKSEYNKYDEMLGNIPESEV